MVTMHVRPRENSCRPCNEECAEPIAVVNRAVGPDIPATLRNIAIRYDRGQRRTQEQTDCPITPDPGGRTKVHSTSLRHRPREREHYQICRRQRRTPADGCDASPRLSVTCRPSARRKLARLTARRVMVTSAAGGEVDLY